MSLKASLLWIGGAVLLGVVAFYLWMVHGPVKVPPRPPTVPPTAVWSGSNKGEWVDCTVEDRQKGLVRCTIFNDVKGDKISSGTYLWKSDTGMPAPDKVKVSGFDGEKVFAGDAHLVPTGRHVYYGHANDSWTKDYPSTVGDGSKK